MLCVLKNSVSVYVCVSLFMMCVVMFVNGGSLCVCFGLVCGYLYGGLSFAFVCGLLCVCGWLFVCVVLVMCVCVCVSHYY